MKVFIYSFLICFAFNYTNVSFAAETEHAIKGHPLPSPEGNFVIEEGKISVVKNGLRFVLEKITDVGDKLKWTRVAEQAQDAIKRRYRGEERSKVYQSFSAAIGLFNDFVQKAGPMRGIEPKEVELPPKGDAEVWVAHAVPVDYAYGSQNDQKEMYFSVTTDPKAPITTHMGIFRNPNFTEKPTKNLSVLLHSFAATAIRLVHPEKRYMWTTPLPVMRYVLAKNIPQGTIWSVDQYAQERNLTLHGDDESVSTLYDLFNPNNKAEEMTREKKIKIFTTLKTAWEKSYTFNGGILYEGMEETFYRIIDGYHNAPERTINNYQTLVGRHQAKLFKIIQVARKMYLSRKRVPFFVLPYNEQSEFDITIDGETKTYKTPEYFSRITPGSEGRIIIDLKMLAELGGFEQGKITEAATTIQAHVRGKIARKAHLSQQLNHIIEAKFPPESTQALHTLMQKYTLKNILSSSIEKSRKLLDYPQIVYPFLNSLSVAEVSSVLDHFDIHTATQLRLLPIIKGLIKKDVDLEQKNSAGMTPLHVAILNNYMDVVALLLENHASTETTGKAGGTAIFYAVNTCQKEMIQLLLNNGVHVDFKAFPGKTTALAYSILVCDDPEIVELFLKAGADIDATNKKGQTAFDRGIDSGNTAIAQLFYQARDKKNAANTSHAPGK